jgi:hypothetical protein
MMKSTRHDMQGNYIKREKEENSHVPEVIKERST